MRLGQGGARGCSTMKLNCSLQSVYHGVGADDGAASIKQQKKMATSEYGFDD